MGCLGAGPETWLLWGLGVKDPECRTKEYGFDLEVLGSH